MFVKMWNFLFCRTSPNNADHIWLVDGFAPAHRGNDGGSRGVKARLLRL